MTDEDIAPMRYGNWEISYNPPPIPFRGFDWQFSHKDFDGAEDACDDRHGAASSLEAALDWIDDWEEERFDEHGCQHGCPLALPDVNCLAIECKHRTELRHREATRAAIANAPDRCALSPFGRHQVDTSMESGPNNCFFCEASMARIAKSPSQGSSQ